MERKTGLDFLRMLLMVLVGILHVLGNGGILPNSAWMSGQYLTGWYLEALALCSVDAFALISGYVSSTAPFRWSRVLNLWLGVLFYSLLITGLFAIFLPEAVGERAIFGAFFPITSGQYWFLTAYVGLFFFFPLLNPILEKVSRRRMTEFLLAMLIFFSFLPSLFSLALKEKPYGLNDGYSLIWLMILYLTGGYFRKYDLAHRLSRRGAVVLFFASATLAWLSKVVIELATARLLGAPQGGKSFLTYLSPMMVVCAIALLCFFAQTEFHGWGRRMVAVLSPAALGVYMIHVHPLMWDNVIRNCAVELATWSPPVMALGVLVLAFAIYLVCSLLDLIRLWLFRRLKVAQRCRKIDELIDRLPLGEK